MVVYDERFVKGINADNPWWSGGGLGVVPSFKRSDYDHYIDELGQRRVCVLLGPRRCGKTTLIMQIIDFLLNKQKVNPRQILFVSLDRPFLELREQKLQDTISYYEENILGKQLQNAKERVYLFADEAHYDSLWARTLKQYVDQRANLYSIVSGSSAAAIYNDQESGAGRFHINQMVTLKFRDIVRWQSPENDINLKDLSKKLRAALIKSIKSKELSYYKKALGELLTLPDEQMNMMKSALEGYLLKGGYPEFWIGKSWQEVSRHYQTDVFDIILQKDVVSISNIREPQKVRTLLVLIAQNTARTLTREKLRETLNLQSEKTVDSYVDALAEAFLVRTSLKYRRASGFPSTKAKKYYAADTGLRNAVLGVENIKFSSDERGALLETAVFNHCLRLRYHIDGQLRKEGSYWIVEKGAETETDIILDFKRHFNFCVPVEVKNGVCSDGDIKKMKITISKLGAPFGFIICRDRSGIENGNVFLLPPWAFMLSC